MEKNRGSNMTLRDELFEEELILIDLAMRSRKSHLRSVDEMDMPSRKARKRKTCPTGKRRFRDKKEADRVLHFIINRRNEAISLGIDYQFKQYRSYLCPCGSWHHSSKPERGDLAVVYAAS